MKVTPPGAVQGVRAWRGAAGWMRILCEYYLLLRNQRSFVANSSSQGYRYRRAGSGDRPRYSRAAV